MPTPSLTRPAVASTAAIRAAFPALERVEGGRPVAYFDGPGGTQVPRAVADAVTDYLLRHNANTHWRYPTSRETDAILAGARAAIGDLFGAAPEEIVFGHNMTTLTFHVARGLGRRWGPGDEVVVTELDHHGNVAPWRDMARERGLELRVVRMLPETGELDLEDLRRALGPRTRLLAIGAASNALGTINDVAEAVRLAHAAGALAFVDAVHAAAHVPLDVRALDCDFLACSAYKFYGPHIGVLWGRHELLQAIDVPKLDPAPEEAPERIETGTLNHEGVAGAAAAIEFLAGLAPDPGTRRERLGRVMTELHRRGDALLRRLWEGLGEVDGVRLFGPPPGRPRTPTLGFAIDGLDPAAAADRLSRQGLFLSHGDFYAATVIERLGRKGQGILRAGCACYTTEDEVDRLVEGVEKLTAGG